VRRTGAAQAQGAFEEAPHLRRAGEPGVHGRHRGRHHRRAGLLRALQRAINDGETWKFQGSFDRAMMAAIEEGRCLLGPQPAEDAWGSRIPSRTEVGPGTKGSREFVAARHGEAWAERMSGIA